MYRVGIHKYKIKNKFKTSLLFSCVGEKVGTMCTPYPELPILMVCSRPGCELRWIGIRPVFLRTKSPEVMVFVEDSLSHAAIACIWCWGSYWWIFRVILLLVWRVYVSGDFLRVVQPLVRVVEKVRQVQGQTCVDLVLHRCWNFLNFDAPISGGPVRQLYLRGLMCFFYWTSWWGYPIPCRFDGVDVGSKAITPPVDNR